MSEQTNVAADLQVIARLMKQYPQFFPQVDARDQKLVAELVPLYLADAAAELDARTLESRRRHLTTFSESFGQFRVSDPALTPFALKLWICQRYDGSPWTRAGVNVAVQRLFNWAVRMRLIRENPFKGLALAEEKLPNRSMQRDEFQRLLRNTHAYFRRFLVMLWLTGARPGELRALRWDMIDWKRGIAILDKHKTRKKTGRPRVIVFPPSAVKLLAWMKAHNHNAAAIELRRILEAAPNRQVKVKEIVGRMKTLGYSYRAIYRARESIGATYRRIGGWREHGHTVYELPENAEGRATLRHLWNEKAIDGGWVFISSKDRNWTREGINATFGKLRAKCGLPMDCKLYGLRHSYISEAVKRGTNLKALATLVGHVNTSMIEKTYCHVADDFEFLRAAAIQAVNGHTQTAKPETSKSSSESAKPANLPVLPAVSQAAAAPVTDPVESIMLRRLTELEEKLRNQQTAPPPVALAEPDLQDCHRVAYDALQFAIRTEPSLAKATDLDIHAWLVNRPEFAGQLPPSPLTFRKYLNTARRAIEGVSKRRGRRRGYLKG